MVKIIATSICWLVDGYFTIFPIVEKIFKVVTFSFLGVVCFWHFEDGRYIYLAIQALTIVGLVFWDNAAMQQERAAKERLAFAKSFYAEIDNENS